MPQPHSAPVYGINPGPALIFQTMNNHMPTQAPVIVTQETPVVSTQTRPANPAVYRDHRLVPEGHYFFSINEKGTPKSRILVRDAVNPALGRVYSIHPARRNDYRRVYYCRVCNPRKYAPVTVYEEDDGTYVHEAGYDKHEVDCVPQTFESLISKQEAIREKLARFVWLFLVVA